ncbi:MAG: hypothetical protein HF978_02005 [Desulfobacteraceae bacterium]|nr:hypothetical protein [Desulfobacteraceae bacterium]MBC2754298.1 hypothetical protein [Desulfobacteraceae bacterium]
MKFSVLLFALYNILKIASMTNKAFKKYISKISAKILIKTEDNERARMFIFDKGKLSSVSGDQKNYDVALVWKDAATGFSVMTSKKKDASFNAAAEGKLKVLGMSIYAQWFEDGINMVM